MNVEIQSINDEFFKITTVEFGEKFLASDGERVCIEETLEKAEDCVESLQQGINPDDKFPVDNGPTPAPLENSSAGHPFNPFGGTSWDDGKRGHRFD